MLHKTEGIILHSVKYAESSLIVKVYTSEFGLQSYMLSGVKGKKSKHKSALLQPLSLVDLIVSNSNKGALQRISEINLLKPYTDVPYHFVKRSIAIFLNEILYKVLKEEHADISMFEFIKNALLVLDLKQDSCTNFHIYFMIQLSPYLGFSPHGSIDEKNIYFDLKEGCFIASPPVHRYYLNAESTSVFQQFLNATFENFQSVPMNRLQRKELLQALIIYYQLHVGSFGEVKSLSILEEITKTA
ncbi:MAG TPA: DNA repair protein RecO [Bacteroidia bacterium]|nr:DNA repair protein RecO [Bacteroidia bacterium]